MMPSRLLQEQWPFVAVAIVFVATAALGGVWLGVAGALLAVLVVGPLFLLQRARDRRRRAESDALSRDVSEPEREAWDIILAGVLVAAALTNISSNWLGERGATVTLLLLAALSLSYDVSRRLGATNTNLRFARLATAGSPFVVAIAAVAAVAADLSTEWLGAEVWTASVSVVAAVSLAVGVARLYSER